MECVLEGSNPKLVGRSPPPAGGEGRGESGGQWGRKLFDCHAGNVPYGTAKWLSSAAFRVLLVLREMQIAVRYFLHQSARFSAGQLDIDPAFFV